MFTIVTRWSLLTNNHQQWWFKAVIVKYNLNYSQLLNCLINQYYHVGPDPMTNFLLFIITHTLFLENEILEMWHGNRVGWGWAGVKLNDQNLNDTTVKTSSSQTSKSDGISHRCNKCSSIQRRKPSRCHRSSSGCRSFCCSWIKAELNGLLRITLFSPPSTEVTITPS